MLKKSLKLTLFLSSLAIMAGIAKPINVDAATTYVTATANLNVRTGASTKYRSVALIKKGNSVKVLSSKNGWYKVQLSNNKTGWSSQKYLTTTNTKSTSNKAVSATTTSSTTSTNVTAKTITVKSYAYTGGGYTAMGTRAKYGTLAVDPKVIPYGTKVYIKELNKVFTAEDCGGGIKGNKVDIYMNSKAECRSWGVRTITLQILK